MTAITEEQVRAALSQITLGPNGQDIVRMGWVEGVALQQTSDGTKVTFSIAVPAEQAGQLEPMRRKAEDLVRALPGVSAASAILTAQRAAAAAADRTNPGPGARPAAANQISLPGVKHIIAVASGKGGVGKSTTAANLALAFAAQGLKTAVFDADIFGPSMPRMFGLSGAKPMSSGDKILPLGNHGLSVMSIGFMINEEDPVIWRGPMVMGALEQLMRDVDWGEQDIMVVDMPPGTGDTQLTMCQRVPLAGAVVVSTPQDIALLDARKGLNMFRKVNVPVLGIIENMSYYVCPSCGHRDEVFSHGGAKRTAEELDAEFLGDLPLDIKIRETADAGAPVTVSDPDSPHAKAYRTIAARIWEKLNGSSAPKGPSFVVE